MEVNSICGKSKTSLENFVFKSFATYSAERDLVMNSPRNGNNGSRRKEIPINEESDEFVYAAVEKFFGQLENKASNSNATDREANSSKVNTRNAAEELSKQFNRKVTRERIYPLLWEGLRRKFVTMNPPISENLQNQLAEKFGLKDSDKEIRVVNVVGKDASTHVVHSTADYVVQLIERVQQEKNEKAADEGKDPADVRVHVGIGAGYVAEILAERLATRALTDNPKLTLHALTPGGFYVERQENSPTAYFLRFADKQLDVKCCGMFSPPAVSDQNYDKMRQNPALKGNFVERENMDILVTSLATAEDEHGLVRRYFDYLKENGYFEKDVNEELTQKGWCGDVLFQPYSATEPISGSLRTIALFTLDELLEFSRKPGKHVVLVGAPCHDCDKLKTKALLPLLKEPRLRMWTQLFIDRRTAVDLLNRE